MWGAKGGRERSANGTREGIASHFAIPTARASHSAEGKLRPGDRMQLPVARMERSGDLMKHPGDRIGRLVARIRQPGDRMKQWGDLMERSGDGKERTVAPMNRSVERMRRTGRTSLWVVNQWCPACPVPRLDSSLRVMAVRDEENSRERVGATADVPAGS